jgi:hypothetical protein
MLRLCDASSNQFARIIKLPKNSRIEEEFIKYEIEEFSLIRIISTHHHIIFVSKKRVFYISNVLATQIRVLIIPSY